jgi:hypothetical protein
MRKPRRRRRCGSARASRPGSRRIGRRTPAARPGRCRRCAARWRPLVREQHAQAVALAGARCAVPAHVPIFVLRRCRRERDRGRGGHAERHATRGDQRAGRPGVCPCDGPRLHGEPTPGGVAGVAVEPRPANRTLLPAQEPHLRASIFYTLREPLATPLERGLVWRADHHRHCHAHGQRFRSVVTAPIGWVRG